MAATLIYIKSRMLLPPDETIPVEEQEDPRAGLVERLLEYQAFKEASLKLREREDLWINAFSRPTEPDDGSLFEPELHLFEMNIFDLMEALKKIFSKIPSETLKITKEKLTMQDRISFILDRMEKESTLRFNELFEGQSTRMQVIVTFLALLEILKLRLARAYQNREFGTIWIVHHSSENEDMTKDAEGIIAEQA
jgi:segregation and condensation protein A